MLVVMACAGAAAHASDGAALFAQNCALCHQAGATGLPGQFPRLAGRIGRISRDPAGRAYLIDVVTYGMVGQISVDGDVIIGVMPPLRLSDEDAGRVLSYVASLGGSSYAKISTSEVTSVRARPPRSGSDVRAERQSLQDAKILE